jgi:hypothetical protein
MFSISSYQKLYLNWSKKSINDISLHSFLEKCSQRSEIVKLKKKKCLRWSNHVVFFNITWKKRCFRFKCWSITLIWTHSSKIKSWTKKTRWWKKLSDLNLHIEYRSNKLNFANDSFCRFDYESNESIIVNAIAKDDNKLIVNRVHVQAFIIEHDS